MRPCNNTHGRRRPCLHRIMGYLTVMLLLALSSALQAQKPDPRTQPDTTLAEAIRLLEAKKYAEFVKTFARPSELEELLAKRSLEEVAADFSERRAPDLLAALKAAASMKPVLNSEGTRADYQFEKPFGREKRITLVKIGELWYLR